jgi:hypothetical protein
MATKRRLMPEIDLRANFLANLVGDADAARIGNSLQLGCNVDAVAVARRRGTPPAQAPIDKARAACSRHNPCALRWYRGHGRAERKALSQAGRGYDEQFKAPGVHPTWWWCLRELRGVGRLCRLWRLQRIPAGRSGPINTG